MKRRYVNGLLVVLASFAIVSLLKVFAVDAGWAERDSRLFHFVIIDYFIEHGFTWDYPQVLPMYPGMHVFFAFVARGLALGSLVPTGWPSFLIQSFWGCCYVISLYGLMIQAQAAAPRVQLWILGLVLFCSSYPLYSWIWPTTELGAFFAMVAMIAIAHNKTTFTLADTLAFTAFAMLATLFRQNYATMAATLFGAALLHDPFRFDPPKRRQLALGLMPLVAVGAIVGLFTWKWGGLLPAELARHGGGGGLRMAQLGHLIALTGLIGLPFAVAAAALMRGQRIALLGLGLAAIGLALGLQRVFPLVYDYDAGNWGSLVWWVYMKAEVFGLAGVAMTALIAIGAFIWLVALYVGIREGAIPTELILFGLFAASLMVQTFVFQRYSEVPIFVVLAVFYLPRLELTGALHWLFIGWFGLYGLISLVRPILSIVSLSG